MMRTQDLLLTTFKCTAVLIMWIILNLTSLSQEFGTFGPPSSNSPLPPASGNRKPDRSFCELVCF